MVLENLARVWKSTLCLAAHKRGGGGVFKAMHVGYIDREHREHIVLGTTYEMCTALFKSSHVFLVFPMRH